MFCSLAIADARVGHTHRYECPMSNSSEAPALEAAVQLMT